MRSGIPFGISLIDNSIENGLVEGKLCMIYGGPGVGKTTFAYITSINVINNFNLPIVFIDNDHSFSPQRIFQLTNGNEKILEKFIVLKPNSVSEFEEILDSINSFETKLIVIDSIASLYRLEMYDKPLKEVIGKILGNLKKIRDFLEKKSGFGIIINQIYGEHKDESYGYEQLQYFCHILIEIKKEDIIRKLILHKHPFSKEFEKEFVITTEGFVEKVNEE
ncbi:MAG: ATPase domain-containing protein [Candidatus Woesearchaeota archaeon]